MANNDTSNGGTSNTALANARIRSLAWLLATLAGLYIFFHIDEIGFPTGDEYKKLDAHDMQLLTAILADAPVDTIRMGAAIRVRSGLDAGFCDNPRRDVVIHYLDSKFFKWMPDDRRDHERVLCGLTNRTALLYLTDARFNVRSYFWLTGTRVMLEIIAWTLFGVICSILFAIGEATAAAARARRAGDANAAGYDPNEIPNLRSRLLFAPFVSIVLVLGYQFFAGDGQSGYLETSKGVVVISFLLGFYSSRAMRMLDKVKDVLLPYANDSASGSRALPGELTEVSVSLLLDDKVRTRHAALIPVMLNELEAATVLLREKTTGKEVTLAAEGPDQERVFKGRLAPGEYTIVATSTTSAGVNLHGEETLSLRGQKQDVAIRLKESGAAG